MQARRYHQRSSIPLPRQPGAFRLSHNPPLLSEGESLELPLLLHRTMCLPGQHFRISGLSLAAAMFICDLDPPRLVTFGLVMIAPGGADKISRYGVTFDAGPSGENSEDISVRAQGKQRFRVLGALQDLHRYRDICLHRVRILPELPLVPAPPPKGLEYCWHKNILQQYDPVSLLKELRSLVKSLAIDEDLLDDSDPSYRLAVRLHLTDEATERLLQIDEPVHRLQFELNYVRFHKYFKCAVCSKTLADISDLICVHNETSKISYKPSHHNSLEAWLREPITFIRAEGAKAHPKSAVPDSRFPGYVWSPAFCISCYNHVGWRFRAEKGGLAPNEFWAFCKSCMLRKSCIDEKCSLCE